MQITCLQSYICWWDAITLRPSCSNPTAVFKMMFSSWLPHEYTYLLEMSGVSMIQQFPRLIKILISLLSLSSSMRHGFEFLMWSWSWDLTAWLHVDSGGVNVCWCISLNQCYITVDTNLIYFTGRNKSCFPNDNDMVATQCTCQRKKLKRNKDTDMKQKILWIKHSICT